MSFKHYLCHIPFGTHEINICNVRAELVRLLTKTDASNLVSREYRFEIKFCKGQTGPFSESAGRFEMNRLTMMTGIPPVRHMCSITPESVATVYSSGP